MCSPGSRDLVPGKRFGTNRGSTAYSVVPRPSAADAATGANVIDLDPTLSSGAFHHLEVLGVGSDSESDLNGRTAFVGRT